MSSLTACDLCGGLIERTDAHGSLHSMTIGGNTTRRNLKWGVRDYHASPERDCLGRVLDAIEATEAAIREGGAV